MASRRTGGAGFFPFGRSEPSGPELEGSAALRLSIRRFDSPGRAAAFRLVGVGNRLEEFDATPGTIADTADPTETPAYARALTQVEHAFADLKGWLPAPAWADARVRAYVPSYYTANIDRTSPVLFYLPMAQLPPRPRELLQALASGACDGIGLTSNDMRKILETFAAAGITPSDSSPLGFGFLLSGGRVPSGDLVPSYLHFSMALPDDVSGSWGPNGQNDDPTHCG